MSDEEKREQIQELTEELCATKYKKSISWKGYEVYEPVYDEPVYIGLPLVILAKGDEVRISTDEESLEYLDYQLKKSGYIDDEEEMLPDDTLTGKGEH